MDELGSKWCHWLFGKSRTPRDNFGRFSNTHPPIGGGVGVREKFFLMGFVTK